MTLHEQILKDKNGNSIGVFLPMADYEALLKTIRDFEDLQDAKDFDSVKSSDDEIIPIEQAFKEIEAQRNDLWSIHQAKRSKADFKTSRK